MNDEHETLLWYIMSKKEDVGYRELENLLAYCGSIEDVYLLPKDELEQLNFLSSKAKNALMIQDDLEKEERAFRCLSEKAIGFICPFHESYPTRLKKLYDPPHFLYYIGQLPEDEKPTLAVIGARNCTTYGMNIASELSKELVSYGIQIISGLARGIDGCAHKGALEGQGKTYGVIGHGVDGCYPRENIELYHKVGLTGGIISEYPIGSKALPFHFPIRNRLIAGLSDGVVVIEAKERSGTLITVDCGLEQGKDIFALPGRITDPLSRGCNQLIQNGAKLVLSVNDIIEELSNKFSNLLCVQDKNGQLTWNLENMITQEEKQVLRYIAKEPIYFENLLNQTGYSTAKLMENVYSLKIKGIIKELAPQQYIMAKSAYVW